MFVWARAAKGCERRNRDTKLVHKEKASRWYVERTDALRPKADHDRPAALGCELRAVRVPPASRQSRSRASELQSLCWLCYRSRKQSIEASAATTRRLAFDGLPVDPLHPAFLEA
jgi:hypothetical protein